MDPRTPSGSALKQRLGAGFFTQISQTPRVGAQQSQSKKLKFFESGHKEKEEFEELTKIKYSIEEMVRKREQIKGKESIEAKFAETLNQIATTATSSPEDLQYLTTQSKQSGFQIQREDQTQDLKTVYKQLKALELKSKSTVARPKPQNLPVEP